VLVSNKVAVGAMQKRAETLGLDVKIASNELYDAPEKVLEKIFSLQKSDSVVLAAGEPSIKVRGKGGKGGRNLHLGLSAIQGGFLDENSVFISFASDGLDNSDTAGAVADAETIKKAEELGLSTGEYLKNFDSYDFFQKSGDLILTGPTGANVSDLMILLTKNE
jgi:glycerate-2-kinase